MRRRQFLPPRLFRRGPSAGRFTAPGRIAPLYGLVLLVLVSVMAMTGDWAALLTPPRVEVWVTTADRQKRLLREPDIAFDREIGHGTDPLEVDDAERFQTIPGFGASLTESSAFLIQRLPEDERDRLMRRLFDARDGIGISYLRQPMGASDFALSSYTYDDVPAGESDPDLARFTIERDRAHVIPMIRHAMRINPDLQVMATPWSPPAWMKTSDSLIGGRLRTDL